MFRLQCERRTGLIHTIWRKISPSFPAFISPNAVYRLCSRTGNTSKWTSRISKIDRIILVILASGCALVKTGRYSSSVRTSSLNKYLLQNPHSRDEIHFCLHEAQNIRTTTEAVRIFASQTSLRQPCKGVQTFR